MALSIMAFAYGIAARFKQGNPGVEITRLKACVAHLREENSRLLDRLSVRLDELNDLKRQLAEARIEGRLASQQYACGQMMAQNAELAQYRQMRAMQNAFAHPWTREIAECTGGGRARYLEGTIG